LLGLSGYLETLRFWRFSPKFAGPSHGHGPLGTGAPGIVNLVAVPGDESSDF